MRQIAARVSGRSAAATAAAVSALALAAAMGDAGPSSARTGATTPGEAQSSLDAKRNELESTKERARAIEADVKALDDERRKINERLVETAALIQSSEARMTAIEARLGELEAQEKLLRGSLMQRHGQIATLLSALLRMGRNPPPVMVTEREDALKMVRSAMLLAAAFPELRTQALALAERLGELVRVMTDVRTEGDRLKVETQRLADARTRLAGLMETKKQTLAERNAELEKVRQAADSIARNVQDLGELIAKLDKAVTQNTALGAYEEETRARRGAEPVEVAAAPQPAGEAASSGVAAASRESARPAPSDLRGDDAAAPAAAGATAATAVAVADPPAKETQVAALQPPPKPTGRIVELSPAGAAALVPRDPGRIKPAIPFDLAKSRLPMPAQGRRVLAYGEKTNFGGQSKGIVLETRSGAQITSPADGWVVYAGEFRSYGQLLIINAGGGYHILLAGLSQIDVQPGQFVLAAEPVGTMAAAPRGAAQGAQASAQQAGSPVLYVEFRKDGRPIDPDPWWAADSRKTQTDGQQKVQG